MTHATARPKLLSVPVVSDHIVGLSFGNSHFDKNPRYRLMTMTELAAEFSIPDTQRGKLSLSEYLALDEDIPAEKAIRDREKNGRYFIPVAFHCQGTRLQEDVLSVSGFAGDIDTGKISKQDIERKLKDVQYIAYSSYSHHPNDPRWRFFIPYTVPIEPIRHQAMFAYFQTLFDGQLDPSCEKVAQLWYTPACPHDAANDFEFFYGNGPLFDPNAVVGVSQSAALSAKKSKAKKAPGAKTPTEEVPIALSQAELERLKSALASISADDRKVWINIGLALRRDLGAQLGLELWLEWAATSAKFDKAVNIAAWDTLNPAEGANTVTLGTVFYLAKENGWADADGPVPTYVREFNRDHFVVVEGGKTFVYWERPDTDAGRVIIDRMSFQAFFQFHANVWSTIDGKKRQTAPLWTTAPGRRSYDAVSFAPGLTLPSNEYNLWRGFPISAKRGKWTLLKKHIHENICDGDQKCFDYLMHWMAFAIQYPSKPAEVAVVLQGSRGTGKGKLADMFGRLFGQHSLAISQAKHLTGNFNLHLRDCVFLFVDEALWAGDKSGESVLKSLITERTIAIEGKGVNVISVLNHLHVMMASNNAWVVPAGPEERRFFVLRVSDKHAQDHAYFSAIDHQMLNESGLGAMMYDLLNLDLSSFNIRSVPRTPALDDQVLQTLDPGIAWWFDHVGKDHDPTAWTCQRRETLRASYAAALGFNNHGKAFETIFGIFMRGMVPGGAKKCMASPLGIGPSVPCYTFPPQKSCKKYLMEKFKLSAEPWA